MYGFHKLCVFTTTRGGSLVEGLYCMKVCNILQMFKELLYNKCVNTVYCMTSGGWDGCLLHDVWWKAPI